MLTTTTSYENIVSSCLCYFFTKMPKRQCPFDYDLVPQLKIHYGQKEYDLKSETNMSKIHGKF